MEYFLGLFAVVMIFLEGNSLPQRRYYCLDSFLSACQVPSQWNLTAGTWVKVRIVDV